MKIRSFPTRQYSYGGKGPHLATARAAPPPALSPGKTFEFLLGKHTIPQEISPSDITARQHDPFAKLVLGQGHLPMTLRELLKIVDAATGSDALPDMNSYVVADGGQIPWTAATANVDRAIRFIVTRGIADQVPTLLISTSDEFDSKDTFLQVIGWDSINGAFQFYERRDKSWVWAGSSWDALASPTRGNGPFDSHVNGALNMKELKFPWINWQSQAATIDAALAPDDALKTEPLWQQRKGAEVFERSVARPGIDQWTESRIAKCTSNGRLERLSEFFRQILDTSTVNLLTSPIAMSDVAPGNAIPLPMTFFLNNELLVDGLQLDPNASSPPSVDGAVYLDTLKHFDVAITDGTMRFDGDTHFVFLYPEVAFEDNLIVTKLLSLKVLSPKMSASLLMVDFCNPVFSKRRKALLTYIPQSAEIGTPGEFSDVFVKAVEAAPAANDAHSPEREFLDNWATSDSTWQSAFSQRLAAFIAAVLPQLGNQTDFAKIFELVESRRREFRKRPLAEFRLTTAITNISETAPLLEFTPTGLIQQKK